MIVLSNTFGQLQAISELAASGTFASHVVIRRRLVVFVAATPG